MQRGASLTTSQHVDPEAVKLASLDEESDADIPPNAIRYEITSEVRIRTILRIQA